MQMASFLKIRHLSNRLAIPTVMAVRSRISRCHESSPFGQFFYIVFFLRANFAGNIIHVVFSGYELAVKENKMPKN